MITAETQQLRDQLRQLVATRIQLAIYMETPMTISNVEERVERETGLELARAGIRELNSQINTLSDRILADERMAEVQQAEKIRTAAVAAEL
jgi:hypothetical protein